MSEIEDIIDMEFDKVLYTASALERTRCSRLAYMCKWTTGHVGGTVGRRLGSSP